MPLVTDLDTQTSIGAMHAFTHISTLKVDTHTHSPQGKHNQAPSVRRNIKSFVFI